MSKSLLFLCVGTVEHQIGSRDIEDMNGLITRMPKVTVLMLIGMAGMFLAPFGMLISKWAAIKAFIDVPYGMIFVVILAFGSALTVFFWAKWMGRLIAVTPPVENSEIRVSRPEWIVLSLLAGLVVVATFLFPLISSYLIEPWIFTIYGHTTLLASGKRDNHADHAFPADCTAYLHALLQKGTPSSQAIHGGHDYDGPYAFHRGHWNRP